MLQRILKKGSLWASLYTLFEYNPYFAFCVDWINELYWMLLGIDEMTKSAIVILWMKGILYTFLYQYRY